MRGALAAVGSHTARTLMLGFWRSNSAIIFVCAAALGSVALFGSRNVLYAISTGCANGIGVAATTRAIAAIKSAMRCHHEVRVLRWADNWLSCTALIVSSGDGFRCCERPLTKGAGATADRCRPGTDKPQPGNPGFSVRSAPLALCVVMCNDIPDL